MGLIKFLDAHCGTILTICIIVVVVAIITHYRLKKVSWEFETEDWQREKCGEIDIKATNCDIAINTYDIKEDELTEQ